MIKEVGNRLLPVGQSLCRLCFLARWSCMSSTRNWHQNLSRSLHSTSLGEEAQERNDLTHIPVMVQEVIDVINPQNGQVVLDMTFGAGGHSLSLLQKVSDLTIYALDRDPLSHNKAKQISQSHPQIRPLLGRFSDVHHLLADESIGNGDVDAVLFDVGASSMQFDDVTRGFALSKDGPLDMRMDGDRSPDQLSAEDVVNHLDESGLYKILKKYGEEKNAKQIARAIVESRYAFGRITTTRRLATVVESAFDSGSHQRDKLMRHAHVATKTFQALRIFVNNELNELSNGLELAHALLRPGGVCAAISFHSLEDRVVKRHFHGIDLDSKLNMTLGDHRRRREAARVTWDHVEVESLMAKRWRPVSRKAATPDDDEVEVNPRSRSAKLRAAVKL